MPCTSTTVFAPRPPRARPPRAGFVPRCASTCTSSVRDARWPATSRPRPGGSATTLPNACAIATGADCGRHRPHPYRRRRDAALPACQLAREPGAARAGAAREGRVVRPLLALERAAACASSPTPPACPSSTTRPTRTRATPATGSGPRSCPCSARSTPPPGATSPRPGPSWPRRRRCSSASCSRRSPSAGADAGAVAIAAEASPASSRGCGGWRCARSPSAPPEGPWRSAALGRRDPASRRRAGGWLGRARRRRRRPLRSRGSCASCVGALDAAPEPVALALPGRARVGDWEVRAELHPGPVDPAGPDLATLDAAALRRPDRGPDMAPRRPHPAARDDAGRRRFRTCSPIVAFRARCARCCRW